MICGRFRLNESLRVVRLAAPGSDRGLISIIPADSVIEITGSASLRQMVEATWNDQNFAIFETDLAERIEPEAALD
jgi:hypothetical protein